MKPWREMTETERYATLKPLCERGLNNGEMAAETGALKGTIAYFLSVCARDLLELRRERNLLREKVPAVKAVAPFQPGTSAILPVPPKPPTAPALVMLDTLIGMVGALDAKIDALGARLDGLHQTPQSPSNRDASAGGEASSTAAPQGEAVHAGIGSETPADREGQHESRHLGEEGSGPSGVTAGETALLSPLGASEAARKRPDLSVSRRAPDSGPGEPQRDTLGVTAGRAPQQITPSLPDPVVSEAPSSDAHPDGEVGSASVEAEPSGRALAEPSCPHDGGGDQEPAAAPPPHIIPVVEPELTEAVYDLWAAGRRAREIADQLRVDLDEVVKRVRIGRNWGEPRIAAGDEKAAMLAAAIMREHQNTSKGDDDAKRELVDGDRGRSGRDHVPTHAGGDGDGHGLGAEAEAGSTPRDEGQAPALQVAVEPAQPHPQDGGGLRGSAVGGGQAPAEEREARHLGRAVLPDLSVVREAAVEPEQASPFRQAHSARWAAEKVDLVRRLATDGKTDQQIADEIGGGVSKRAICKLRLRHRIETKRSASAGAQREYHCPKWPDEQVETLRALAADGKTDDEIIVAMGLNVRRGAIVEVRQRYGIEAGVVQVRRYGPSTQIGADLGEKVLDFWAAGASGKETEAHFGLGRGQLKAFLMKARQAGDPRAKARAVRGPEAKSTAWPPERMAEVERLVREEGKSDLEIARIMGATKGMIVGIRNRARIPSVTTLRREAEASTPKSAAPPMAPVAPIVRQPVKPVAVAPKPKPPAPIKVVQRYGDIDRDAFGLPIIAPTHEQEVLDSVPEPAFADGERITIMMLTAKTCRWPSGHPGNPDFTFCGKRSAVGRPYCADHVRIAYQPLPGKRKSGVAA